jgi:hypothetical protein
VIRFEIFLAGVSACGWLVAILAMTGILPLAGGGALDLYRFYSLAAVLGWVIGNIYVFRWLRHLGQQRFRKRALVLYLIGPPSLLYVVRALAPLSDQQAAPLVPLFAFAVYGIFLLIPLTLRATPRRPR